MVLPVLVSIGHVASVNGLANRILNSAWLSAELLFEEPDVALPNVPSSKRSQPVSATVLIVNLTSPVVAMPVFNEILLGFKSSQRVLARLYRRTISANDPAISAMPSGVPPSLVIVLASRQSVWRKRWCVSGVRCGRPDKAG